MYHSGYHQDHSRGSSFSGGLDLGSPSKSSGYQICESRKLPYSGYYSDKDKDLEDKRDLDQSGGGGRGEESGGGYVADSAESVSTDPDTYDSQHLEVC